MESEILTQRAKRSVVEYNPRDAAAVAKEAVSSGTTDLKKLIYDGYAAGMKEVGEKYNLNEIFLPHVMASSVAMKQAMTILMPELEKKKEDLDSKGKIVICTPQGDIHSIGKDIVATMLRIAGFETIDLGSDVPLDEIIKSFIDNKALAICTSASMTSTMFSQMHLERMLIKKGIRDEVLTNIGGAPVTQAWADEIGADMYSENATDAVSKFLSLMDG